MRQGPNGRRPRGRPNRKQQHGGPQRPNNFDSSGPEGRIRGNAHQVYEKYVALARDAVSAGDRVAAETYFQHAEHYFRIVNQSTDPETAANRQPRPEGRPEARDGNGAEANGRDDEGHGNDEGYQAEPGRAEQRRPDGPRPERHQGGQEHADRNANGGSRGEGGSQPGGHNAGQRQQGRRPDANDAGNGSQPQSQPSPRGGEDDREGLDRVLGQDNNAGPRRRPRQRPQRVQNEASEQGRPSQSEPRSPDSRADAQEAPSGQAEGGEPGENKPDNEPVGA